MSRGLRHQVLLEAIAIAFVSTCLLSQEGPPMRLLGRIVDVLGDGVPGAGLILRGGDGRERARASVDGDGVFELRAPLCAGARIDLVAPGKVPVTLPLTADRLGRARNMVLEDAVALRVTVHGADGAPLPAAVVTVAVGEGGAVLNAFRQDLPVDDQGAAVFSAVPTRPIRVSVWAPGHGLHAETLHLAADDRRTIVLPRRYERPRVVRVQGLQAEDLAACRVLVAPLVDDPITCLLPAAATSIALRADGTAAVWSLPVAHELSLIAPRHSAAPLRVHAAADAADEVTFAAVADLAGTSPAATPIRGRLLDDGERPVRKAWLLWADQTGVPLLQVATDDRGEFSCALPLRGPSRVYLLAGPWRLRGEDDHLDRIHGAVAVATDATMPLELHAERAAALAGRLMDRSGAVLEFADVRLFRRTQRGGGRTAYFGVARTIADRMGHFELRGLRPGAYTVAVRARTGRVATVDLTLDGADVAAVGPLDFAAVGELTGVVRDASGRPRPGVRVHAQPETVETPLRIAQEAWTDRNGRYRVSGLPAGAWSVGWDGSDWRPTVISDGGIATVDLLFR